MNTSLIDAPKVTLKIENTLNIIMLSHVRSLTKSILNPNNSLSSSLITLSPICLSVKPSRGKVNPYSQRLQWEISFVLWQEYLLIPFTQRNAPLLFFLSLSLSVQTEERIEH